MKKNRLNGEIAIWSGFLTFSRKSVKMLFRQPEDLFRWRKKRKKKKRLLVRRPKEEHISMNMAPKRKVAVLIEAPEPFLGHYKNAAAAAESQALVIHKAAKDLKTMKTNGKESKVRR